MEILIYPLVAFVIANLFYFIFFNRKDIQKRTKWFLLNLSSFIFLSGIILFFMESLNPISSFFLFLMYGHLFSFGYFFLLLGVNHLIQKIPIINSYFTYTVAFSVLMIPAILLYIPVVYVLILPLTLDYRL